MVPRRCQKASHGARWHLNARQHLTVLGRCHTALHGARWHLTAPGTITGGGRCWCWCAGALVRRQSGKRLRGYAFRSHFPLLLSTKTPILCSKRPKTGVPDPKSAQKPRFCARKPRKDGSRRPKKHKNLEFVLEMSENKGSKPQKRTKIPILCSGRGGLAPGRDEISFGKHNMSLPANHRARFQNANTS